MINKFTAFGEAVVAASMLVLECPDNTIHLGPAIKGLLPGIYKVAEKKSLKSMNCETFLIYKVAEEAKQFSCKAQFLDALASLDFKLSVSESVSE